MAAKVKNRFRAKQVLDGGVSTEIATTHGHGYIDADPLWSSRLLETHPEVIKLIHERFLQAGADVIGSITYMASIPLFMTHLEKSEKEAFELITKGVKLAVDARDEFWSSYEGSCLQTARPLVAGALGPYASLYGQQSDYTGVYIDKVPKQTIADYHRTRIAGLLEGGADLIACETIPALGEALILAELSTEFPDIPFWMTFSCKDGEHVCHGETFKECFQSMLKYDQIFGVGINCTPPQHVEPLLKSIPKNIREQKTIIVYPNSGEFWESDFKWHKRGDIAHVPDFVSPWLKEGALWVGGCCRTTPKDISEIRTNMDI